MNFAINNTNFSGLIDMSDEIDIKSYNKIYNVVYTNQNLNETIINTYNEGDFIIIDRNVYNLDTNCFIDKTYNYYLLDAREQNKNINIVLEIINILIENNFNKKNKLIIIGGGITQDIGGFVGALYKRGVSWVLIPTTLLAIADSCIGSKVNVNHVSKNILGLFCAPDKVIISSWFLNSLSNDDITSGIGEILKLALIGGHQTHKIFIESYNEKDYIKLIKVATSIKKLIIEYDELEKDERRVLNYGHTIGHAIESATNYFIPHGIAVLYGMLVKNKLFFDEKYDNLNQFIFDLIPEKFKNIELDYKLFIKNILNDKKNKGSKVCFILLEDIGKSIFIYKELSEVDNKLKKLFQEMFKLS